MARIRRNRLREFLGADSLFRLAGDALLENMGMTKSSSPNRRHPRILPFLRRE
jgi:hypothetical protein